MSITTYNELTFAVKNWLQRNDLNSRIPEFIVLGEALLYTKLRCREMESSASATITTSTRTTSLPTNWVAGRRIYISDTLNYRLEYKTPAEYWSVYADLTSARPSVYTIEGENFVWGPLPDAGYTATVLYYQRPAALSSSLNSVFTRWPNLYLFSALLQSAPFLGNDPRLLTWTAMLESLIDDIHEADKLDRMS